MSTMQRSNHSPSHSQRSVAKKMANGWTYDRTKALISIWGQEGVQRELDGVARNRTIFERIASELGKVGVEKTWQQCRSKIKNLTFRYRKVWRMIFFFTFWP